MAGLPRFQRYLGALLGKLSVAQEVDQELDFHVEMRTRELVARGMDVDQARATAIARFGDLGKVSRRCRSIAKGRDRSMNRYVWFEQLRQDLVFAARQVRRAPVLTAVVTITLAVAIAANSTVFSVGDAVLLRPLPYPQPERLVRIQELTPEGELFSVSAPNLIDFREQQRSFTDIAAISGPPRSFALLGEGEPQGCTGLTATGSLFAVLGFEPMLGRTFTADEQQPGAASRVAVISHGMWQRHLGSRPGIIGETVSLDGEGWTIVGVLPADFSFPYSADIWVPLAPDPEFERGDHRLELFARLKDGVALQQARADLDAVAVQLGRQYPESNQGWGVLIRSFPEWLIPSQVRQATLVLAVAVVLMLLLACTNVSNLLIVRITTRYQEIATRVALGASRGRVIRQLLTESVLLAMLGAAAGILLTLLSVATIRSVAANALPRLDELAVDNRVLLFTLIVSLIAGALSGLAPALQVTGGKLAAALKSARQGATPAARRLHDVLVVAELSLALMLLIGAGLLVRSYAELNRIDPGFQPEQVITAELILPESSYGQLSAETSLFFRELIQRVEAIPGVSSAGATMVNPFRGNRPSNEVGDEMAVDRDQFVRCQWRTVTPGFFQAMGIPLLSGRLFSSSDRGMVQAEDAEVVAVISASLAERLWPGEDAPGKRLKWSTPDGMMVTVVGVVGDIRDIAIEAEPSPMFFFSHEQVAWPAMTIVVKAAGDPTAVAAGLRQAIWAVDKSIPAPEIGLLDNNLSQEVAGPRLNTQLLGVFALLALLIAAMGVYGVISYRVTRRRRELGVRLALGAESRSLISLVLRQGLGLVMVGTGLGILGALALSRLLASVLYGVSPTSPVTYATVALLFAAVAAVACYLPARRAARVNPVVALRAE
jgi:predicted permease